MNEERCYCAVG